MRIIDVRSDTVTQPTIEMRKAMFEAEVGDDVYRDDSTVNELERLAAQILGKEAALFVASGTMANQLGILSQTKRGDEVIVSKTSHIFEHEVGGAAVLSGVTLNQLEFEQSIPIPQKIVGQIRGEDIHEPETSLICLENALANGRIVPVSVMREVYHIAQRKGLKVHLDGARVFNAAVSLGVDVNEITQYADTVNCCLSKGLCAPVGSILAGETETIERARKFRKMLGGGMRQAGFLAAAGILAIRDMTKRLQEDHDNAKRLAQMLDEIKGIEIDVDAVQINMVFFTVRDMGKAAMFGNELDKRGIKINSYPSRNRFRFVTHHGVTADDMEYIASAVREILK